MIKIENFTYSYPNSKIPALKDINLKIQDGEFILIIGSTGSGKSTLLYCLNGLIPHTFGGELSGEVLINGFSPKDKPIREISKIIGTVFQNPDSQIFMLKAEDDVAFGCENLLLPKEEIIERRDSALREIGLSHLRDNETFKLSGGQKQRLAISSIYAMGPSIFLFDEPTTDLDQKGRQDFLKILRKLKTKGNTIILVEHQYEEFLSLADKVVILEEGKVNDASLNKLNQMAIEKVQRVLPCLDNIIDLQGIYFEYEKEKPVLRDVNLKIKKGELVAVLGDNGSGKTTLFKILLGLLRQKQGKVTVFNLINPSLEDLIGKVGFLFQNPDEQLFANSVKEEIAFGPKQLRRKVDLDKYLNLAKFHFFKARHPQTLSRGQRQLLALVSILAMEPEIIILDEPTTGLDYKNWYNLLEILNKLATQGKTVIFSTHNMKAKEFATRLLWLDQGRIITDEILR